MKLLICVRNGDYNRGNPVLGMLNTLGEEQIIKTSLLLKEKIADLGSVIIWHSSHRSGRDTASIMMSNIENTVVVVEDKVLSPENHRRIPEIYGKISSFEEKCDVLILVSHHNIIEPLVSHMILKRWRKTITLRDIKKGEAVIISLEDEFEDEAEKRVSILNFNK
jgi:phosphohistidine phosphatase SixA